MSDATDKILADLPTVQQIALRPMARNPLLSVVLEQAAALQEIAGWAGAARQLADQPAPTTDAQSDPATIVDAEAVPTPTTNGSGRPTRGSTG